MPDNGEYMTAAYVLTAVIYVGYWVRLRAKARGRKVRDER